MAQRPIFLTEKHSPMVAEEKPLSIQWHGGFSVSQKKKNIIELHKAASHHFDDIVPLEISTKSDCALGIKLSAFNLAISLPDGAVSTVECAYQGSKVFERGGAFTDLYQASSLDAKRDKRLWECGALKHFNYFGHIWALEPKTAFYDWLYISALIESDYAEELLSYTAFTDIEFNPKKSFNCQARAAAMYVSIKLRDGEVDLNPDRFLNYYKPSPLEPEQTAMRI